MTSTHVFIATSLDGLIAKPDGDIGWLVQRSDPAEDHGYQDFIERMDAIVMGRGTYEKVLGFEAWPYALPVIVLSEKWADTPVPEALAGKVRFSKATPKQVMAQLAQDNCQRIYIDGGQVIQSFLREGLLSDMVITTVPVLLGSGIRLFGALADDVDLKLVSTRCFASGFVQSHYQIAP